MKKLLFLSILLQLIVSCTSNEYKKLEEVYACLRKGQNKSALLALSAIEKDKLSDSSSIAYYYLLKAQAYYKTSNTHNVDTLLDRCIRYYEKEKEYELLARSYYYKACVLKDREMFSDAISNAKKCEKLVLIHCIDDLMHQIYDLLAGLNFQTGNFNQSLSYNRRALAISSEAGDEKLILADKIKLSTTFRELNMRDSSEYYTLKANDIAKVGNEVMKANALDNLSVYYLNRNRLDSAEYFIRRSLHISPSASSNIIYGDIKRRQGKLEEANGLWGKVSKEDALDLRIKALACMSDYKKEKGLYKDAVLLQDSMIALKNSLKAKQHSEENIQIQAGMDFEAYVDETGRDLYLLINAVVCAAAVIFAIMVGFFAKSRLAEKEVSNGREKMEKYKQDIRQSEQKNMEHVREKQKMQKRIDNLNDRHSYIIAHGKQLFEEIENGGNTAEWNKTCFDDCVEYLRTEYPDRLKDIDIHYTGLTSQNIFFLFMKATGMKDRQLAQLLNISYGAVRTMGSRLKSRHVDCNS